MATTSDGIFVFPEAAKQATSSLDPNLMLALQNNGGFGNNNWIWILFLWMIWGNNGWCNNGFGGNGGTGYLANQMSNDAGRDLLLQAINGRADAAQQLALATNTSVNNIQAAICSIQSAIQGVSNQVGVTGMQIQNAIQSGDATIGQQICQAACDNKFAIANQTNTLQNQLSSNHSSLQLQLAQQLGADQLAMCKQTNTLVNGANDNTQRIIDSIASQSTMISNEFNNLKDREYRDKIESLTADNALLRSNINNATQTQQFAEMLAPIQAKINAIIASQPSTITLPNTQYAAVHSWYANIGNDVMANYISSRFTAKTAAATTGATT